MPLSIRGIDMGKILFKIFEWGVSSGLAKFIKGMGLSMITFAFLNQLIQTVLAESSSKFGSITGLGANALGLAGVDTALAIMAGAIIAHVYMRSKAMRFVGTPK